MAEPYDPTLQAVRLGLLDRSVLPDAARAQLARPCSAPPPLLIDLVEPDAPEPWGDRMPCHMLMREVEWHAPLPAELAVLISGFGGLGASVVRDHVDYPGNDPLLKAPVPAVPVCPPCHGRCHQGRSCPASAEPVPEDFSAAHAALVVVLAALATAAAILLPFVLFHRP